MFGAFGIRLKSARESARISKSEAARRMDIDPQRYGQIENEKWRGRPEFWEKAAEVFGVRLSWLLTGEGPKSGKYEFENLSSEDRDFIEKLIARLKQSPAKREDEKGKS